MRAASCPLLWSTFPSTSTGRTMLFLGPYKRFYSLLPTATKGPASEYSCSAAAEDWVARFVLLKCDGIVLRTSCLP